MKIVLTILCWLIFAVAPPAYAWTGTISAAEWARPRSGLGLIRFPVLQQAVAELQDEPSATLQIRYPGGDMGSMWASELKAWLVALGVTSSRLELLPGGSADGAIELQTVVDSQR